MKKSILFVTFFVVVSTLFAQNQMNNSLGNLVSIDKNKTKQAFTFKTTNGTAVATIYSPNIIRIRIARQFGQELSYAVVGDPIRGNFDYAENDKEFIISTDSLILQVTKNPVRFTFKTKDGKIISQDDPAFGTSWVGAEVSTYKVLQDGEKFIGLGEKTGNLNRRGNAYINWNTDNPNYDNNSDPIYASIPFYMGIHHNLNYGIFLDNSYRTIFNFGASSDRFSFFSADDGEMDYYFIYHTKLADIITSYTWLTGRMQMPPMWALGYQQCRWSYTPDNEVLGIARTFREKNIPIDVIYLDIDYMDAYKIFTQNPKTFSNPQKLLTDLKALNFRLAVIVDPGIKVEKGYQAYEEGIKNDYFVKYPDGKFWTAQVWPGWCHFPDFTKPTVRTWWGEKFKGYVDLGVEGFWNDMNEIATWGQQPPSLIEFDREGSKTTYRQAKNIYGMQMARSTFEGTKKLMNGRRPLIITRAGFAGLQRYTSIWTGDNHATDHHMMLGVRLVNSLGLSGVSFTGSDVGGFQGNATPELFARWITLGAFTPFYRSHSSMNTASAEPWVFGENVEAISRNYIQLRYNLLPYVYCGMRQSTINGLPMNRSLAIGYTYDDKVFDPAFQNQFLFGPSMLVIPVESDKQLVKAYLPEGNWFDFYTDEKFDGMKVINAECPVEKLPVFVKSGSIIPMQSPVMFADQKPSDTLFVHLYKDDGKVDLSFDYYEDDGTTYQFEAGDFYLREIIYKAAINEVVIKAKEGKSESKFKKIQLVFHGFDEIENIVKLAGKPVKIEYLKMNFQMAAEKSAEGHPSTITCPTIVIPNSNENMVINW
jgi:alpha-glucosidase